MTDRYDYSVYIDPPTNYDTHRPSEKEGGVVKFATAARADVKGISWDELSSLLNLVFGSLKKDGSLVALVTPWGYIPVDYLQPELENL